MAMNFSDLIGAKSIAGSIHNWVNYRKTPVEVVLEEAQAMIFALLRVRQMKTSSVITLPVGAYTAALPARFQEAIAMRDRDGIEIVPDRYISEAALLNRRSYNRDVQTTLTASITAGATTIAVAASDEFPASGDFSITIDNEAMLVTAGHGTLSWTVTRGFGGTTAAAHSSAALVDGMLDEGCPSHVAVFGELFQFDCKADDIRQFDLVAYCAPEPLSASNQTNFLTARYPTLLRVACQAQAASFAKDAQEWNDREKELIGLIEAANAESDLGKAA